MEILSVTNKRFGRVLLSETFVSSMRSRELFEDFVIFQAMPRFNDPGIIAYYGSHPDFAPWNGKAKDSPYYQPYWNNDGMYFNLTDEKPPVASWEKNEPPIDFTFAIWMKELNKCCRDNLDGMNVDDFEDYNWRDEYENGVTPEDAFSEWHLLSELNH